LWSSGSEVPVPVQQVALIAGSGKHRLGSPDMPEAERRQAIAATLVQREGRPENIAQAVLYLIDNDFVTGDCLRVDGGRTIYARGN